MVSVAQLVEPRIVIPVVVGSSPIVHPSPLGCALRDSPCFLALGFFVFLFFDVLRLGASVLWLCVLCDRCLPVLTLMRVDVMVMMNQQGVLCYVSWFNDYLGATHSG